MAAKTITVTGIAADDTITLGDISHVITAEEASAGKVTVAGIGTFDFSTPGETTFVADAALAGEYEFALTDATVVSADFSKTTAGIQFAGDANVVSIFGGKGNDTLTTGDGTVSVNAGAGNDKVIVSVAGSVTLGDGADTLVATAGEVAVGDYSYYQGDLINVAGADNISLASDGKATVEKNGSVTVTGSVGMQDNWYALKVNDDSATVDYFTAVGGNNVSVSKDLSKAVIANVIDASGAASVNIALGHGNDSLTLSGGADTIVLGKAAGSNDVASFDAAKDVISVDGVKLADLSFGVDGTATVGYAATTLKTDVGAVATDANTFLINDGTVTRKVAVDLGTGNKISYDAASDADWFIGDADTVLEVGATTHLHETDKYKGGIAKVSVASGAELTDKIYLTGAVDKANEIDATNASVGVGVWGYSSEADNITLGSAQDTVYFGTGDGDDTVTGFAFGSDTDSDILYLYDTKTLGDIKVAGDGTNAKVTAGKSVASINGADGTNDIALVQLADGKVYTVAGAYKTANVVTINTDKTKLLDYYAFSTDAAQTVSITGGEQFIFNSLYTDFMTAGASVGTIDASAATGDVTLAAAANIKGGKGISNIWTYQSDGDANVSLAAGEGTDSVWFAEGFDKKVTVSDFEENDTVKFALAGSLKNIAENYTFVDGGTNTTITGVNDTDSTLILSNVTGEDINFADAEGNAYKARVANAGAAAFATDVNIYAGMVSLTAGAEVEGEIVVRVGKESRGAASENYYIADSVTTFDASNSTAKFVIAGSSEQNNTIKGGLTENMLYGGGASSDELYGSLAAVDTFFFGTGDGNDAIKLGVDAADKIALWNVADADIANVTVTLADDGSAKVVLSDTSTLSITDAKTAIIDGLTFTSATNTAYKYDSETGKLVQKA